MSFWDGRRVLVTGAGGFIGSHVVEDLVDAGASVRALVHYNARADHAMLADLSPDKRASVEVVLGDVTDAHQMMEVVEGIDTVFHLAALIAIPYSYHAPASYVATNVNGTLNLLEGARRANVRSFIQTSTSEVYGSAQYVPIDEKHPLQAQSPYAATKIASDQLALSFHRAFEMPVLVVRPFNTFGPRQSARAVIPTILTQLLADRPVRLGSLDTRRDFTLAADTARGFRMAAESSVVGTVVNLGTGKDYSILEVAETAARMLGKPLNLESDPNRIRPSKSEVDRLLSNPAEAKALFGWEFTTSLDEGLRLTAEWLKRNASRYDPTRYTI